MLLLDMDKSGLVTLVDAPITPDTRVLLRADFDVPLSGGKVVNDFRIKKVLPTIKYLLKRKARVRIISYLGRPEGKHVARLSLKKIHPLLEKLLGQKIAFVKDPLDVSVIDRFADSKIVLFENIRFWKQEGENDLAFAKKIAQWGDIYVNEAFANAHRVHATTVALPKLLPAFAGLNFVHEVEQLLRLLTPEKPCVVILGGLKIETKLPLIFRFIKIADRIIIGGALIKNVVLSQESPGQEFSFTQHEKKVLSSSKLYIPEDVVLTHSLQSSRSRISDRKDINPHDLIADIGPKSIQEIFKILDQAKTVLWNGPLGYSENKKFSKGTVEIAKKIQKLKAYTVIGGGDSVAALEKYGVLKGFSHVSTGGGVMLEFLSGKKLPAIEVLKKRYAL